MHTCTRCETPKPLSAYSKDSSKPGGHRKYCKDCASAYDRNYRQSPTGAAVRKAYKQTPQGRLHRKAYRHRRRARHKEVGPLTSSTLRAVVGRNRAAYGHLTCIYCKAYVENQDWHLEHRQALSRGGDNSADNLAIACPNCNIKKGVKDYKDVERYGEDHLASDYLALLSESIFEQCHEELPWAM